MSSFKDLVKQVNANKKTGTSYEQYQPEEEEAYKSHSSFKDLVKKVNNGTIQVGSTLNSTQIDDWYRGSQSICNDAYSYLTKDGYKAPNQDIIKKIDDILAQSNDVSMYLRTNKDYLSDFDGAYESYIDMVSGLRSLRNSMQSSNRQFGQWESEEEFNTAAAEMQKYYDAWGKYADAEDFEEKSQYKSTYRGGEKFHSLSGTYTDTGFDDITYDYINGNKTARGRQNVNDINTNTSLLGIDNSELLEMRPEEISLFNYIYATEGSDKAYEYIAYITSNLNARQRATEAKYWKKYAKNDPVGSSVFSILVSPMKGLSYIGQSADYFSDGSIDQNAGYNKFSYANSAIRNEVSAQVEKKWGAVGSFAYQTGMSMGDFLVSTAVSGGNQAFALAIMGTGAAADATMEAKDRGLTDDQAFALGTIAGAAEIVMEKIGLDALLDMTSLSKSAMGYLLKNILAEGGEELGTSTINLVADILVSKDKSHWQMSIDSYRDSGLGETEAFWRAVGDQAVSMGLDFLGGAISGGAMGGGAIAVNKGINAYNANKVYGADPGALVGEALEIDPNNPFAQKMQSRLDNGKNLSGGQLNRLVQQNEKALSAQDVSNIQKATEIRLTELGETGDVTALAKVLTKQATGEKLSRSEQRIITDSKYGQRVANELNTENIQSGDYTSAWSEKIGTKRINTEEYNKALMKLDEEKVAADATKDIALGMLKQSQETTETTGYTVAAEAQNEAQSIRQEASATNISEDGVTRQVSTGKEITPKKIVSLSGNKAMVETDNGTISADDIQFGNVDTDLLWRSVIQFNGIDTSGANGVIRAYLDGDSVTTYLQGAAQEFKNGYNNLASGGKYADKLTAAQRTIIYELAQKQAVTEATENAFTPEGNYEVASDGKAVDKDGNTVNIKGVASVREGEMILDLGDGKSVNAKNITYANESDALIYEAVANMGDRINAETANKLIAQYKGGNAMVFSRGIAQAYTYGFYGLDKSEMNRKDSFASDLTEAQKQEAYKAGKEYRAVKDAADKAKARLSKAPAEKGVYYRDKNGKATDIRTYLKNSSTVLKEVQSTAIEAMEKMSKMMGVRFNVFESWVENGKRYYLDENGVKIEGNPNGFYDPRTGEIYIDLNAGNGYEGVMLFTVAHELTHFLRQWSPEHFTKIAKIVFRHGNMKGNVAELVALKQAKAKAQGKNLDYDAAMEELVADGMETILKDGKVVEFMAEVKQKDHKAWKKIKEWFQNLADFLKSMVNAYSGRTAQTEEGRRVAEFSQQLLNQLEQIFAEGALEAGENYQKAQDAIDEKSGNQSTKSSNRQPEKNSLATEEPVKYSNRENFFPGNVFPSGKTHTDAFEWAHRKDVKTGDKRLMVYRGTYYRVEKFDDMDFGYLITKKYDAQDYNKEEKEYGEIDIRESYEERFNNRITRYRETVEHGQGGYHADPPGNEYRGENRSIHGVGSVEDGQGRTSGKAERDRPNSLRDQRQTGRESLEWTPQEIYDKIQDIDSKLIYATGSYATRLKNQRERYASMIDEINGWDQVRLSDRDTESVSNRALLANALESVTKHEVELKRLREYKENVANLDAEEQKLRDLNAQIKELSFAKGPRDTKKITDLRFNAVQTANRIATLDKILLRLEAATPLQNILKREKDMVRKREKQRSKEALAEQRAAFEAKQKETIDKWRDSRKAAVAKARETADKRDARAKLQKLVLDTVKWISYPAKTDVKCPDILKKPYSDFLNSIDLSSKRLADGGDPTKNDLRFANAMGSLATALDKIMTAQDPTQDVDNVLDTGYLDLPANFVEKLRDMTEQIKDMMVDGDYVVNTMTAADVRKLSQMIRTLNHAIKTMSKLYANMRFANIEALGVDTMEFVDALGELEKTGGIKDFVQWDNALPYYAFKRFGAGGESVFEGLMDAQDKLAFLAQKIFDFSNKAWTGKEAKAWSEDTHTIDLPNGNKLTLTTADAMSIYCLSRREQGLQHLLGGGTRVMGIQKGSKKAKDSRSVLTIKDIDAINSSLTERQRNVAEAIQEFMSTVCSDWGNEISMKRFLTKEFNEKFYFPIESNDENLPTKDPAAQQSDLFRLLNISATKPITPGANNEVIIRNIFDVFTGHASDMARLNAYGMALLDYMKWLNYREKTTNEEGQIKVKGVRKSMEQAFGNAARGYVLNLIKDVNGRPSDGGLPSFYTRMVRNAKTAMVGSSLRVATLQITSYPRAALVLSPKSLALGLTKVPNIKRAKKYCGIALWKSFGFYDTNISRSIEDQMKGVKNVQQKLVELSLKGAEWGDAITWGALWNACEYEVAKTTKNKIGSEEFYQEVGKKLREVVYRTQVVDSTLTRSEMMRSKNTKAQELSAFMSEPTLSANILMDAGFQFSMEKRRSGSVKTAWKNTGKYVGRAVAVYSIGQLAAALLEGLWDAYRDDEDEEFGKKYLDAFIENLVLELLPINKIPVISELAEAALSLAGLGYFSSDNLSSTAISQTVAAVKAWVSALSGESSTTTYNALYKTVRAISSFVGVSFSGVMREGVALWNNTAGAYDSTLKIRQYELSKGDLGNELYEAIIAGDTRQADSLKVQFEDQDSMHSAVRKALRDNDPRIKAAAQAQLNGDPSERVRIAREIIADGFIQDNVVMAINTEIAAMTPDDGSSDPKKAKGFYTAEDFATEIANGDQAAANAAKTDVIRTAQKNGKSEEDAVKSFNSAAKTALKEQFLAGNISEQETINALTTFCGVEEQDAMADVQYWAI